MKETMDQDAPVADQRSKMCVSSIIVGSSSILPRIL